MSSQTLENRAAEDRRKQPKDRRYNSTVIAAAVRHPRGKFKTRPCLFCNTPDHNSSRCSADLSLDRRKEILTNQKRCFKCFRQNHLNPTECAGPSFPCTKCNSTDHYAPMHQRSAVTSAVIGETSSGIDSSNALLWTSSAYVVNGGLRIPIRIFIDGGSSITVVLPSLRRMLREAPVGARDLNLQAFASSHSIKGAPVFNIRLTGPLDKTVVEFLALEHDFGVHPPNVRPRHVSEAIKKFDREHPVADRAYIGEWNDSPPAILVGMDQIHKIVTRSQLPVTVVDNIVAQHSRFGWLIGGPTSGEVRVGATVTTAHVICCSAAMSTDSLPISPAAKALQTLWSLESVGIAEAPSSPQLSADEDSAIRQFESGLTYENDRYVVTFPKRETICLLPNNRAVALKRLERKLSQLEREPSKYQRYHEEIMKFVHEGHACEVGPSESTGPSTIDGSYFMPHHEVITGSGPWEKWRIVFDCSSKDAGATSLNDHLLPGPNLNPELVTVLLNFRLHPVAVSADITKAYLQLGIRDEDRSLFNFLWRAPGERLVKVFQMTKVIWGATSSGFLLAATVREHLKRNPPLCQELGNFLYADDFLQSFKNDQEAIAFTDDMRKTLGTAGMTLAKWKTNSNAVTSHLLNTGVDSATFDRGNSDVLKVLGLLWEPSTDVFRLATSNLRKNFDLRTSLSKRAVLSTVASLYDPLGWLMPFTIRGKIIVQRMWTANTEWSQTVSDEIRGDLVQWVSEAETFERFDFRRRYDGSRESPISYRLHLFGDASQLAYACAAYIECRFADGTSTFSLAMSKSRLAPRDQVSLPRLELLAALIAVRLKTFLVQRMEVQFEAFRFYTDSTIAFHWATSAKPGGWKTYVSNRVAEIQASSKREDWFHVQGSRNVSDLATRGISAQVLTESAEWWYGPTWLRLPSASNRCPNHQLSILLSTRTRLVEGLHYTFEEKNPVVIPGNSRLAVLLIIDAHRVNAHFGVSTVLNQLRRRFWITRGRQVIKSILRRCVVCRKRHAAPATQIEAPLPQSRTEFRAPFGSTGIDFCGPFHVRHRQGTQKAYVAVFTCMAIRAIHLELVPCQSTPQTHLAIRRFLAAYPACTCFVSDNGASFVKAATELKRLFSSLRNPAAQQELNGRTIDWKFICPRSPWHGGFYERVVGIFKSALIKTLGRSLVGYEELRTILCEVAGVINERPLTFVSADPDELTAITPAQFLRGGPDYPSYARVLPVDRLRGNEVAGADELRRGLASRTTYFKSLSVRWFREYLALLRTANTTRGSRCAPIEIGDVCLVKKKTTRPA
ncbi:uncharacterized protein LOC108864536 [Galendromus occidentalis]|uniref:Uncharacterized protein LOC108864536 n=1 Tax=Galendromus occidentalis TaxID=34638 RepID=A0AAJ7PA88_9ACAR|nr:uncharacterized protein LOC108864536 [Galendromus occidentalis]